MSGHNKWSKIKNKKAAEDAKKSRLFAKLAKLITVESRRSSGDLNDPGLKAAIDRAKKENMPKENIERAVERGSGSSAENLERVAYECYGPGGVAIIIEALTDNRNRTASEIKHVLSLHNLNLSNPGAASWLFVKSESGLSPTSTVTLDEKDSSSLERLLDDIGENEDVDEIYTNAS